jgi:thymidylate synthase ThyX
MVEGGMPLEDAREIMPVGIHCNLVAKYNFRSAIDLIRARESARVQGPYREVAKQMKQQILQAWPWAHFFFRDESQLAYDMLGEALEEIKGSGAVYKGTAGKVAKAIDLLKGSKA